jgi:hypothetical protein
MSWFKVDDKFHAHPKIKRIPRRLRRASLGLWVIAGSWCADYETDGAVPEYMLDEFDADPEEVGALIDVGLWDDAEDGIQFRNWGEFQPTRAQNDHRREQDAERQRKNRQKNRKDATTSAKSHSVTGTGVTRDKERSHADVVQMAPEPQDGDAAARPWSDTENRMEEPMTSGNSHAVTPGGVTGVSRPSRTRPDPTPSTSPLPPEDALLLAPEPEPRKRAGAFVYPDEFERFWAAYPDTRDKKKSFEVWRRVTREVPNDVLVSAAERYRDDPNRSDGHYTKIATSWLNAGSWENGPLPPRGGGAPNRTAQNLAVMQELRAREAQATQALPPAPQAMRRLA